jgi:DNA-damage-inducible protein J
MSQALVNFGMDEEDKKGMEEVSIDPFYSDSNMSYLRRITSEVDSGQAKLAEHPLKED